MLKGVQGCTAVCNNYGDTGQMSEGLLTQWPDQCSKVCRGAQQYATTTAIQVR